MKRWDQAEKLKQCIGKKVARTSLLAVLVSAFAIPAYAAPGGCYCFSRKDVAMRLPDDPSLLRCSVDLSQENGTKTMVAKLWVDDGQFTFLEPDFWSRATIQVGSVT